MQWHIYKQSKSQKTESCRLFFLIVSTRHTIYSLAQGNPFEQSGALCLLAAASQIGIEQLNIWMPDGHLGDTSITSMALKHVTYRLPEFGRKKQKIFEDYGETEEEQDHEQPARPRPEVRSEPENTYTYRECKHYYEFRPGWFGEFEESDEETGRMSDPEETRTTQKFEGETERLRKSLGDLDENADCTFLEELHENADNTWNLIEEETTTELSWDQLEEKAAKETVPETPSDSLEEKTRRFFDSLPKNVECLTLLDSRSDFLHDENLLLFLNDCIVSLPSLRTLKLSVHFLFPINLTQFS